jgi:CheY-like chemotaxis protein
LSDLDAACRPLRVLLAEDGPVNQEVATALLEMLGHSCDVAESGREAIEAFQRKTYDVILMDLDMPDVDGFEATRQIRALERDLGTHVPIVAMTAHAIKGFRQQCLEAGMDDHLTKPIQPVTLMKLLRSISESTPDPNDAVGLQFTMPS